MEAGDIIAGNETMHRQVLDLLQGGLDRHPASRSSGVQGTPPLCYCRFCAIIAGDS